MNHRKNLVLKAHTWCLLIVCLLLTLDVYSQDALPHFAQPDAVLDLLDMGELHLSPPEKLLFTSLQGLVNATKPRIYLEDRRSDGWLEKLNLRASKVADPMELLKKYKNEISGVILFSSKQNEHFINLATTIGGIKNALPVNDSLYETLKNNGIDLPVLVDLRSLQLNTAVEVYTYLYENYWKECNKRLYISLSPRFPNDIRDVAIASKSAVIWLDPRKKEDSLLANRFLADMPQGSSCILGWWPEERSGVGLGTKHGISTIAADFFENMTVFGGQSHEIDVPRIPKMPKLENKIYLAIYMSDGDNIQYCEHSLVKLWGDNKRGSVPINWTISPALYDAAPQMLNYYYKTATDNDCFSSGPSGLGYTLIYDALNTKWNLQNDSLLDRYTRFSSRYLERCGLRIITIWDDVSLPQMKIYAKNCRYLYGNTREDWGRGAPLIPYIIDGRMPFIPNRPGYVESINDIFGMWKDTIQKFDGKQPLFLSAQGVSWKMTPENIQSLQKKLEALSPGNIVICRADHFFNLYLQAHHCDFNICLLPEVKQTGKTVDLRKIYQIDRLVLLQDAKSIKVETSLDNHKWTTSKIRVTNGTRSVEINMPAVAARYVRIGSSQASKELGGAEVYGK